MPRKDTVAMFPLTPFCGGQYTAPPVGGRIPAEVVRVALLLWAAK
jgi:hypothetical protein